MNLGGGQNVAQIAEKTQTTFADLNIMGQDGDDFLALGDGPTGSTVSFKNLTVNDSNGDNTVLFAADSTTIGANLSISSGAGNNTISSAGSLFRVLGNTTINHGVGDSSVSFTSKQVTFGNLSITNLDGSDNNSLGGDSGGTLTVNNLSISDGNGGSFTSFGTITTIKSTLNISNGSGVDEVAAFGTEFQVGGNATIAQGNGDNRIDFVATAQNTFANLSVTNLDGHDVNDFGEATTVFTVSSLSINDGNGGSATGFHGNTIINSTLSIKNGAGSDFVQVFGTDFHVHGNASIAQGSGDSHVEFATAQMTLANLIISSLDGDVTNTFGVAGSSMTMNSLTINQGNGDSSTTFAGEANTINGNLKVTAGDGLDKFLVPNTTKSFEVKGATSFNLGNGGSLVQFGAKNSTTFGSAAKFLAGDGVDSVLIGFNDGAGGTSTVSTKGLTFNLGRGQNDSTDFNSVQIDGNASINGAINLTGSSGNDALVIATADGDTAIITCSVTMTGLDGSDEVDFGDARTFGATHGNSVAINGALVLNLGDGESFIQMADLSVSGTTTFKSGADADRILIDDTTFNGAVSVDTGASGDTLTIESISDDGRGTEFKAAVKIKMGSGDDSVTVIDPNKNGTNDDLVTFDAALTLDGGNDLDTLSTNGHATLHTLGLVGNADFETQT